MKGTPKASMFPGIGWKDFKDRYWPHRPFFRKGNAAHIQKMKDLATPGGIVSLAVRSQMELKAMLPSRSQDHNEIKIGPSDILPVLDAGGTIACNSLHRWHQETRLWTGNTARLLTGAAELGVCNAYMSPAGIGVPMHFDDHEIIVVQLAGKKVWTYSPNLQVVNPTANSGKILSEEVSQYAAGPAPDKMPEPSRTVTMSPGSFLFLPRGFWHETDATELSISLTFGFRTPCWAELISDYLQRKLILDARWREPARIVSLSDESVDRRWQELAEDLESRIRTLTAMELGLRKAD